MLSLKRVRSQFLRRFQHSSHPQSVLKTSLRPRPMASNFFSSRPLLSPNGSVFDNSLFRRTFASAHEFGTSKSAGSAIWTIIAANTVVFGAWQYAQQTQDSKLADQLKKNFLLSRYNWEQGRYWTLLTSAFSHTNTAHFLFNMMTLHAFGSLLRIIPGVGATHVLTLAIGSGLAGSAAWLYQQFSKDSKPKQRISNGQIFRTTSVQSALGASGMVMGFGSAAAFLMPFAPMGIMFIPIPIPAWILVFGYAAVDAYYLHSERSLVGHAAHLGGSIFGAFYYFAYLRKFGGVWQMLRRLR